MASKDVIYRIYRFAMLKLDLWWKQLRNGGVMSLRISGAKSM